MFQLKRNNFGFIMSVSKSNYSKVPRSSEKQFRLIELKVIFDFRNPYLGLGILKTLKGTK